MVGEICRLCLKSGSGEINWVFDKKLPNHLPEVIRITCGIEITKSDPITQMICSLCLDKTIEAFNFRTISIKNDQVLQSSNPCVSKNDLRCSSCGFQILNSSNLSETNTMTLHVEAHFRLITDNISNWLNEKKYSKDEVEKVKKITIDFVNNIENLVALDKKAPVERSSTTSKKSDPDSVASNSSKKIKLNRDSDTSCSSNVVEMDVNANISSKPCYVVKLTTEVMEHDISKSTKKSDYRSTNNQTDKADSRPNSVKSAKGTGTIRKPASSSSNSNEHIPAMTNSTVPKKGTSKIAGSSKRRQNEQRNEQSSHLTETVEEMLRSIFSELEYALFDTKQFPKRAISTTPIGPNVINKATSQLKIQQTRVDESFENNDPLTDLEDDMIESVLQQLTNNRRTAERLRQNEHKSKELYARQLEEVLLIDKTGPLKPKQSSNVIVEIPDDNDDDRKSMIHTVSVDGVFFISESDASDDKKTVITNINIATKTSIIHHDILQNIDVYDTDKVNLVENIIETSKLRNISKSVALLPDNDIDAENAGIKKFQNLNKHSTYYKMLIEMRYNPSINVEYKDPSAPPNKRNPESWSLSLAEDVIEWPNRQTLKSLNQTFPNCTSSIHVFQSLNKIKQHMATRTTAEASTSHYSFSSDSGIVNSSVMNRSYSSSYASPRFTPPNIRNLPKKQGPLPIIESVRSVGEHEESTTNDEVIYVGTNDEKSQPQLRVKNLIELS